MRDLLGRALDRLILAGILAGILTVWPSFYFLAYNLFH